MALWKRGKTWWADVTVCGTRYRESLKTTDHREARALEKELVVKISEGKVAAPTGKAYARLPFEEAAAQYLNQRKKRLAERTIQFETERLVPLNRYFGSRTVGRITADDIAAYQQARAGQGISGRTINMEIGVVQRMMKKAKRWALLAEDVTRYPEASHIGWSPRHIPVLADLAERLGNTSFPVRPIEPTDNRCGESFPPAGPLLPTARIEGMRQWQWLSSMFWRGLAWVSPFTPAGYISILTRRSFHIDRPGMWQLPHSPEPPIWLLDTRYCRKSMHRWRRCLSRPHVGSGLN